MTRKAAEILGPGFDVEIVELHHRRKKDAPSGTATTLAEILTQVRRQHLAERAGPVERAAAVAAAARVEQAAGGAAGTTDLGRGAQPRTH